MDFHDTACEFPIAGLARRLYRSGASFFPAAILSRSIHRAKFPGFGCLTERRAGRSGAIGP